MFPPGEGRPDRQREPLDKKAKGRPQNAHKKMSQHTHPTHPRDYENKKKTSKVNKPGGHGPTGKRMRLGQKNKI